MSEEPMRRSAEHVISSPRWEIDHWWSQRLFLITPDKAWLNQKESLHRLCDRTRTQAKELAKFYTTNE